MCNSLSLNPDDRPGAATCSVTVEATETGRRWDAWGRPAKERALGLSSGRRVPLCLRRVLGPGYTVVRGPSCLRGCAPIARPVPPSTLPGAGAAVPAPHGRSVVVPGGRQQPGAPGERPSLQKAPGSSNPAAAGAPSVKDPVEGPASPPTGGWKPRGHPGGFSVAGARRPSGLSLPGSDPPPASAWRSPGAAPGPRH